MEAIAARSQDIVARSRVESGDGTLSSQALLYAATSAQVAADVVAHAASPKAFTPALHPRLEATGKSGSVRGTLVSPRKRAITDLGKRFPMSDDESTGKGADTEAHAGRAPSDAGPASPQRRGAQAVQTTGLSMPRRKVSWKGDASTQGSPASASLPAAGTPVEVSSVAPADPATSAVDDGASEEESPLARVAVTDLPPKALRRKYRCVRTESSPDKYWHHASLAVPLVAHVFAGLVRRGYDRMELMRDVDEARKASRHTTQHLLVRAGT